MKGGRELISRDQTLVVIWPCYPRSCIFRTGDTFLTLTPALLTINRGAFSMPEIWHVWSFILVSQLAINCLGKLVFSVVRADRSYNCMGFRSHFSVIVCINTGTCLFNLLEFTVKLFSARECKWLSHLREAEGKSAKLGPAFFSWCCTEGKPVL